MNYDEFKNKNKSIDKSIDKQQKDLKKKSGELKKKKLQLKLNKLDNQKRQIQKKFSVFTAGPSSYN